jgi:putative addiction module killer protein
MIEVRQTKVFSDWLQAMRDDRAVSRILLRIGRFRVGNFGDAKRLGERVSEARVDHGPGYRVYLTSRGTTLIILLCGGDKRTQAADILRAKRLAEEEE